MDRACAPSTAGCAEGRAIARAQLTPTYPEPHRGPLPIGFQGAENPGDSPIWARIWRNRTCRGRGAGRERFTQESERARLVSRDGGAGRRGGPPPLRFGPPSPGAPTAPPPGPPHAPPPPPPPPPAPFRPP